MKAKSQCSRILKYLETGKTLTPAQAYARFGVLAMHSRAAELRRNGWIIGTQMVKVGSKYVGRYSLLKWNDGRLA